MCEYKKDQMKFQMNQITTKQLRLSSTRRSDIKASDWIVNRYDRVLNFCSFGTSMRSVEIIPKIYATGPKNIIVASRSFFSQVKSN